MGQSNSTHHPQLSSSTPCESPPSSPITDVTMAANVFQEDKRVLRSRNGATDENTTAMPMKRKAEQISHSIKNHQQKRHAWENKEVISKSVQWTPVGKVDVVPICRRSGRANEKDYTACEPRIRKRKQKQKGVVVHSPPAASSLNASSQTEHPIGLHSFRDWITKDLEKSLVKYYHARLKYEGAWEELELDKTVKEEEPEEPETEPVIGKSTEAQRNRKSGRIAHTPSNVSPGIAGKRIGFAPYTLRDSRCLHALHCVRNASEPIQISEGRHGQDARFIVEEMPDFLHDLAEEIRSEFPGEFEPPSLDYAQINVINVIDSPSKGDDEAISLSPTADDDDDKCNLQSAHGRRNIVLDYHKDHLTLGDIAVLCLQGTCTLRMRRGTTEYSQLLRPRTLYLLRGPAREIWDHAVDDVHGERISVIFRSRRT